MMLPALSFALLLAGDVPDAGAAQDWLRVSAHAELPDAGPIGVGQPLRVVIEAEHAPGGIALLPEELKLDPNFAERRAARRHVRSGAKGTEVDRYELEVLAFEAGDLELPRIPLAYGSTRADTPRLEVTVRSGFSEAEQPVASSTRAEAMGELEKMAADDPAAQVVLVDDYTLAYAGGALLALGAIAFFVWRWLRARGQVAAAAEPPPPPRPAHEVAIERLQALRKAGYLERRELKAFFVEVSEILRAYVGGRYGFESLELTVDELMIALARVSTPGLDHGLLKRVLDAADLVKFAKFEVDVTEAASALSAAEGIVERTRPVATPIATPGSTGGASTGAGPAGAGSPASGERGAV